MKKIILSILLLFSLVCAKDNDVATKDDIRMLSEQMDKRFEQIQHYMDKRFEQMDKRFEQMQHNMDKRFDDQMSFLYLITTIFTTFTIGVIGFALWDRNTIVSKAKDDIEKNSKLTQLIEALKELSKKGKELENVLRRYGVS